MAGTVLFQIFDQEGKYRKELKFYSLFEKNDDLLSFSTSGLVIDGNVLTCTSHIKWILNEDDQSKLDSNLEVLNPNTSASYWIMQHNDIWKKLKLIKVFYMKELIEFKNLLKENYAFMLFEGEVTNEVSLPAQKAINIVASPYGILSQEIYLNSHASGFLSLALTEKIALIQTRIIEGIEGGLVLMPEKAILLPSKFKGFGVSVMVPKL